MKLLVTNDDGVGAVGMNALADALRQEHEVTVVAPAREQSGIGHAFTFQSPLHFRADGEGCDYPVYAIDGTPSDCVKFAVSHLLGFRPDAVVSGINLGENSGVSSIYSGTVAAAREGALWGIPSFAFSICGADATHVNGYARMSARVVDWLLNRDTGALVAGHPRTFYNVNYPTCAPADCRGLCLTRQSLAFFDDHYQAVSDNGHGEGYVLSGEKQDLEPSREYDSRALLDHYATLTPMGLDATDHSVLSGLRDVPEEQDGPGLRVVK